MRFWSKTQDTINYKRLETFNYKWLETLFPAIVLREARSEMPLPTRTLVLSFKIKQKNKNPLIYTLKRISKQSIT